MDDCIDLLKAETSRYNSIGIKIQRSCSEKDYKRACFNGEIFQYMSQNPWILYSYLGIDRKDSFKYCYE